MVLRELLRIFTVLQLFPVFAEEEEEEEEEDQKLQSED